ncbi:unnamed protein product [Urochloa humidicola]
MSPSTPEPRDWAALHPDILLDVFLRLGPREVMLGAEFACKPWRNAALKEPALWRRIDMEPWDLLDDRFRCSVEVDMWLVAVDRAKGQCQAFKGYCRGHDLLHLVQRAPSLRSLNIEHYSDNKSGEDLVVALKKLTVLEDLQIKFTYIIIHWDQNMLHSICQACPHLKKLVLSYASYFDLECNENEIDKEPISEAIPVMSKLQTLKLNECDLSNEGLEAILDNCPLLETLHIDGYFNKHEMPKELETKCSRVKNLNLPTKMKP